ncbi:MAG TPA: hypothetical protein VFY81_10260, partial [Gammaproteobacteria bacterium]|nr:hypothetical protein [Gammaproteobacteria bacterium]
MLEVFGLPELPRRWSVRLSLPLTCEVTAGSEEEAFDAAENAICEALIASGVPIDPDWTDCEQQHATPGEVDHDAL